MFLWISAVLAGAAIALLTDRISQWGGFALTLAVSISLGACAARLTPRTAFRHGAALGFVAGAIGGFGAMTMLYIAPASRQPSVLPPWPMFALAMLVVAGVAGAVSGTTAVALAHWLFPGTHKRL